MAVLVGRALGVSRVVQWLLGHHPWAWCKHLVESVGCVVLLLVEVLTVTVRRVNNNRGFATRNG
jgi:hypothetical protein